MGEVGCLKDGAFQNLQVEGPIKLKTKSSSLLAAILAATDETTLTAEQSGQTLLCDFSTASCRLVLPTATVGLNYTIVLDAIANATPGTGAAIFSGPLLSSTSQSMWGVINIKADEGTDSQIDFGAAAVAASTTSMKAIGLCSNSNLSGGVPGDKIYIECMEAGKWYVNAHLHSIISAGLLGTVLPFSANGLLAT